MKWLLIDSCGAQATLAIGRGEVILATETLAGRDFSAQWPSTLRRLVEVAGWTLNTVRVIGLVSGPGSFTGVRVGLAAAKGLCEATGAKLVTLSRLAVVQTLGDPNALAALDAGRGEVYIRDGSEERLLAAEAFAALTLVREVASPDARVLQSCGDRGREVALGPTAALPLLLAALRAEAFADVAAADANYVRGDSEMYAKPAPLPAGSAR